MLYDAEAEASGRQIKRKGVIAASSDHTLCPLDFVGIVEIVNGLLTNSAAPMRSGPMPSAKAPLLACWLLSSMAHVTL